MYEYEFVKLDAGGFLKSTVSPSEDYRQIIRQHARDGWRLVQVFAPPVTALGVARYFELIFEKAKEPTATGSEAPC